MGSVSLPGLVTAVKRNLDCKRVILKEVSSWRWADGICAEFLTPG